MLPEGLQFHPGFYGFPMTFATFHLFTFLHEEITGVHNINVLYFLITYKYSFIFSHVKVHD